MMRAAIVAAVLGTATGVQAADDVGVRLGHWLSGAGWKLFRGITNVGTGLIGEMLTHMGGGVSKEHATTIGSTATGLGTGFVNGIAYGVVRTGSGIVDIATFPLPFLPVEDNRPLVEPEFKL
jgi:putative exosortase-associated protein (TIGR04073 family)